MCTDVLFWPHFLYSALSPIIFRRCMQYTGDAHFNVLMGCGSLTDLTDTGEKIAFGSAFPGSWQGKRIYRRSRAHRRWRKSCTYPCCTGPFPTSPTREWVFLSFAGRVLLAAVFSCCCSDLPSDGLSHWEDEKVDQTKETERKSSWKPGADNCWWSLVSVGYKNTAKYTLSKSFNTIYFMLK